MSQPEATPITAEALAQALDGCGLAVGFALAGALNTAGVKRTQILTIAESLQTLSIDGRFPGPAGDCMGGLVQGMQSYLIADQKEEGAPLV